MCSIIVFSQEHKYIFWTLISNSTIKAYYFFTTMNTFIEVSGCSDFDGIYELQHSLLNRYEYYQHISNNMLETRKICKSLFIVNCWKFVCCHCTYECGCNGYVYQANKDYKNENFIFGRWIFDNISSCFRKDESKYENLLIQKLECSHKPCIRK